ncbi:hypothetical protein AU381_23505 [Sinorhizobium glycinis]|uniref:Uncharacterized protein n=1 Tax=Sinorhizobium glycinis TaxID=1472378 RepID=A0A178XTN8_9HYPH|nr:hypothetical protein AU381_23505 [Sinorhizobium glycinis]
MRHARSIDLDPRRHAIDPEKGIGHLRGDWNTSVEQGKPGQSFGDCRLDAFTCAKALTFLPAPAQVMGSTTPLRW